MHEEGNIHDQERYQKLHPSVKAIMRHFRYEHLPADLQKVSRPLCRLAWSMALDMPDDPEKTAGLRKLLEAKDCFVRAAVTVKSAHGG